MFPPMTLTRASEHPDIAASRQTGSLAALALTLLLVVAGLYLVDVLRACSATEDCLLAGRTGCEASMAAAPILRNAAYARAISD